MTQMQTIQTQKTVEVLPLALKPKQAAKLIGVGTNAIYTLCHRADFPAIKVGSGYIIPTDALRNWLQKQSEI
jgi:excisionase family DNA binding protein